MGSWFNAFSNFIQTITEFIIEAHDYFINLFRALKDSLVFVYEVISNLPSIVSAPIVIIIGIMIAKFVISLGKQ